MPAIKPTVSYEWAKSFGALKLNPPAKQLDFGWTTSNDLITGVLPKPILQYYNGWNFGVYEWLSYLEQKTDETISLPSAGQVSDYLLKTDGSSNFSWSYVNSLPFSGQVADYFLAATSPTAMTWQAARFVPSDSTAGYVLKMTSASTYGWTSLQTSDVRTVALIFADYGTATLSTAGNDDKIFSTQTGKVVTFTADLLVLSTSATYGGETRISTGLPSPLNATAVNVSITGIPFLEFTVQARINAGVNWISLYKFEYGDTLDLSSGIPSGTTNFKITVSGSYIAA